MQLGSAITEYMLPGVPVTAAVAYLLDRVVSGQIGDLAGATGRLDGELVAATIAVFLGVSYMVGITVHWLARRWFKAGFEKEERRTWQRYGPYCEPHFIRLGPTFGTEAHKEGPGWALLRIRYYLCQHAPLCTTQIDKLQTIARAARGALGLPLAMAVWIAADLTIPPVSLGWRSVVFALIRIAIVVGLYRAVRKTYCYRWGVVCRATVAAFLGT